MKRKHQYSVYIMTNRSKTLYTGVTGNLAERVNQHKTGNGSRFTSKYRINQLVYFENYIYVNDAIFREKQIKGWRREKKVELIESVNPNWEDLSAGWFDA
ncbi:MAG TPA: GIY-YIG nuclease family protein [Anaerolineales bacterium]|nr:GIY-YIG nuclease family protein [Anaerolineales bacterium]